MGSSWAEESDGSWCGGDKGTTVEEANGGRITPRVEGLRTNSATPPTIGELIMTYFDRVTEWSAYVSSPIWQGKSSREISTRKCPGLAVP